MRAWATYGALALNLFVTPVAAQTTEGEAHIASAFTSGADPQVLASDVKLGPALRAQLGADADSGKAYAALVQRTAEKPLRVTLLPPAEAARHAALVGDNLTDPLITLEAGELTLLFRYNARQKQVAFVEQLSALAPRAEPAAPQPPVEEPMPQVEAPQLPPEAPKPPTIVEVPLPAIPPAPPPVVIEKPAPPPPVVEKPAPPPPPVVEKPKPAPPVAVQKPKPAPPHVLQLPPPAGLVEKPKPAPVTVQKPRPRGECVIKPVMSEEDLWNCSAPARPTAVVAPPPPLAVQKPEAPAAQPPRAPVECVIKPVMSDEDLRNCARVSATRATAAMEKPPVIIDKPQPSAAAIEPPKPKPDCVIKPVMSDEELRNCASVATPRATAAVERPAPAPAPAAAVEKAEQQSAPQPRRECVIKPVMSEEDLRACAAVSSSRAIPAAETPVPPAAAQKSEPPAPPAQRDCVIKPVMSEEDLRACGVRR